MAKYERVPEVVEAEQFFPDKPRPRGVEPQQCYCADLAQDGRRCELHKSNGRRYGLVKTAPFRHTEICKGDWIVTYADGRHAVYRDENFRVLFRERSGG